MDFESTIKYKHLIALIRKVAIIVGCDAFDPHYKINYRTIFTGTLPIGLAISYLFMLFDDQPVMFILEGLVMVLLVFQVYIRREY